MGPIKFVMFIMGIAFSLGIADSLVHLTMEIAGAAANAQMHHQISLAEYNRFLWSSGKTSFHKLQ